MSPRTAELLPGNVMSDERTSIIELAEISKVFTTDEMETHALAGVDLQIRHGELLAITGPSGCGKSTLLAVMGLLESPTAGQLRIHGHDVARLSLTERARVRNHEIGFVFQNFNLIGDMTTLENVELPLSYRGFSRRRRGELAAAALERVDMLHRAGHYPSQLSGGQQQRVAVARSVAGRPSIVLADEPTGNLDSANGRAVMELLTGLHADGTTVCLVTHDQACAHAAERTVRLLDGRVVGDTSNPGLHSTTGIRTGERGLDETPVGEQP